MNRSRIIINFVVLLIFVILILCVVIFLRSKLVSRYTINLNQTAVIKEIQSLNRLETASFTIEKVIDAGTSGNAIQQFLVGDRILLIAHGQVIAGFDLSKITAQDISVTGKSVRLQLPPPQILVTSLDDSQTKVYDRRHGILNPGDKDLETKVRQAAGESIRNAACQEHILDVASQNGKKQIESLLKGLGFETVILVIPSSAC